MFDIKKVCRHYKGYPAPKCKEEVQFLAVSRGSCFGDEVNCDKYSPYTPEEQAAHEAEVKRAAILIAKGLSPCCEAELDKSQVSTSGRHKGHGPRYCSKCKALVYLI